MQLKQLQINPRKISVVLLMKRICFVIKVVLVVFFISFSLFTTDVIDINRIDG